MKSDKNTAAARRREDLAIVTAIKLIKNHHRKMFAGILKKCEITNMAYETNVADRPNRTYKPYKPYLTYKPHNPH